MSDVRPLLDASRRAMVKETSWLPRDRAERIAAGIRVKDITDEMEGAGEEGLCWAAFDFRSAAGTSFVGFATVVVDRAIFAYLRKEARHRRLGAAAWIIASWGATNVEPRSEDAIDVLVDDDHAALDKLRAYVDAKVMAGALALTFAGEAAKKSDPEDALQMKELFCQLNGEMAGWSEKDRALIEEIYDRGRTLPDAARQVGMEPGAAKARQRTLLRKLRRCLDG